MIYVGLDLSNTSTGMVAINESTNPGENVLSWIIKPAKCGEPIIRKLNIARQIIERLKLLKTDITIGIEGYSFSKFGMAESAELGGIVKAELFTEGFDYSIFPPTSIKKFACGRGSAKKELMIAAVFKRWGFDTDSNDLADAFAIAKLTQAVWWFTNEAYIDNINTLTEFQYEVVKNLVEPKPKKRKVKNEI